MLNKCYNIIFASTLLLCLIALPVSQADLMCYVCDDCETLPQSAPLLACNEDFFNTGGSTEASTVTTTTPTSTTDIESTTPLETSTTITTTTTTEGSTTVAPIVSTTEESTSTVTESTESTEEPIPTPNTAGPVETTTGVPQPPEEDLDAVPAVSVGVNSTRLVQIGEESSSSTPLAIRQRRAVIDTDYSYHCYTVQKSINGSMITDRGCSRVSTYESVCDQLKIQNNNTQLSNCDPCSMNACNGSTGLKNTLIVTILLAAIAALMQAN